MLKKLRTWHEISFDKKIFFVCITSTFGPLNQIHELFENQTTLATMGGTRKLSGPVLNNNQFAKFWMKVDIKKFNIFKIWNVWVLKFPDDWHIWYQIYSRKWKIKFDVKFDINVIKKCNWRLIFVIWFFRNIRDNNTTTTKFTSMITIIIGWFDFQKVHEFDLRAHKWM